MAAGGQLAGLRVLIVEDDFFLAMDEQFALEDAGAQIVGPCADEATGLSAALADVDCAVLDLNLGNGPSFEVAAALRSRGVPFLIVTGYDAGVIPPEFSNVTRLQKPVMMRELVRAVSHLSGREALQGRPLSGKAAPLE
jgi:DNA-binding response OmpR family regulator